MKDNIKKEIPKKEDNPNYCIFEDRFCEYANKNGNIFDCKAPSDDAMTCK